MQVHLFYAKNYRIKNNFLLSNPHISSAFLNVPNLRFTNICHDTFFQTFCDIKSKFLQCVYNVYNQRRRDETERIGKKVKINWISICKTNIKKWGI